MRKYEVLGWPNGRNWYVIFQDSGESEWYHYTGPLEDLGTAKEIAEGMNLREERA